MAAKRVKVWYDREGDYLEVMFEQRPGYFRETGSDAVMEKVDEEGNILGFSILRVSALGAQPLDVALYTVSFVYLLSSIQFDALGHYASNPQYPYFANRPAQKALEAFQAALAQAEITIYQRNLERPVPYLFQLPSRVPNSISI